MDKSILQHLFLRYIKAFEQQQYEAIQACYQMPCTLHTPDKVVVITDQAEFTKEFSEIFTVLSHANIKTFNVTKATYSEVSPQLAIVCIDWEFIAQEGEVFTDFSAFYHIALMHNEWKIVNVVSQELTQSKTLAIPFDIIG